MLVEFASAVDAVTFAVGTRAARCLRFCETDPPLRRLLPYLETAAKLLKSLEGILSLFSKCALKSLNNQTDFDSAVRKFDPPGPARLFAELGFFNYSTPEQCTVGKMVLFIRCFQRVVERNASPSRLP